MAENERIVAAPRERVSAILADPECDVPEPLLLLARLGPPGSFRRRTASQMPP
jgi:hypothetical protein